MDRYIKRKVQLIIILFLLFFIALLLISMLSISQQGERGLSVAGDTTVNEEKKQQEDVATTLPKITSATVSSTIKLNAKIKIEEQASIDSWVIVTIVPEDKKTDPGLIVYQHTENEYVKVIGPGTSFTIQQMKSASIPDTVIYHPITKRYLSGRS